MSIDNYSERDLYDGLEADWLWFEKDVIQKAKNNDAVTLNMIVQTYYENKNYSKALAWCRRSVTQNNSNAQFMIGYMCQHGLGVPQSDRLAMRWYLKAADNDGHKEAQYTIGGLYLRAQGVPKNVLTAIEWYTKSANQGHTQAQFNLGGIYEDCNELKDLQKSVYWYKKAADNGHKNAKWYLNNLISQGYSHYLEAKGETVNNELNYSTIEKQQSTPRDQETENRLQIEKTAVRMEENMKLMFDLSTQGMLNRQEITVVKDKIEAQQNEIIKQFEETVAKSKATFREKDHEIKALKAALAYFSDDTNYK